MKLVKLTQARGPLKGTPIYINPLDITFVRPDSEGTAIAFSGGQDSNYVVVQEDTDSVVNLINEKGKGFEFSI